MSCHTIYRSLNTSGAPQYWLGHSPGAGFVCCHLAMLSESNLAIPRHDASIVSNYQTSRCLPMRVANQSVESSGELRRNRASRWPTHGESFPDERASANFGRDAGLVRRTNQRNPFHQRGRLFQKPQCRKSVCKRGSHAVHHATEQLRDYVMYDVLRRMFAINFGAYEGMYRT